MNKPKVLFVDDELITLKSLALYFGNDFEVFTARDGLKALSLLEAHNDVVALITDYLMPGGVNGLQLIKQAKSTRPGLACFLVTGYTNTPEILAAKSDNLLEDTFSKPFDLEYLQRKICSTIG